MTFTLRFTHEDPRFRDRLAANLRRSVHPAEVEALGKSRYRFTVEKERAVGVWKSLRDDVLPWGADLEVEGSD